METVQEEIVHPDPSAPGMDQFDAAAEDAASATGSDHLESEVAGEELPKTGLMCCGLEFGA